MTQPDLFSSYSYKTSLPAYQSNTEGKKVQRDQVLQAIQSGSDCILKIHESTHIKESTISGRISDLIKEVRIKYDGFVHYKGMKRKRIVAI